MSTLTIPAAMLRLMSGVREKCICVGSARVTAVVSRRGDTVPAYPVKG